MKRFTLLCTLLAFTAALVFAVPENVDNQLTPGPKPKDRPSVALVLAGGGAKGFAHLPVIEEIEKIGIPIDMVVGTSIGSIIGGMYSAGYSTTEILKIFKEVDWSPMFNDSAKSPYENALENHSLNSNLFSLNFGMDFSMKLGTGLSNGQNVYQLLRDLTLKYPSNKNFDELNIPFRAVVTDMLTGNAMVLKDGDLAEAIRASMSLPSIFTPYEIDGYHFMDGGVRYNLAINVAKNMGYDIIIAVDISQKVRDNPDVYSSNPAVAMLNTITISQYSATEKMYKDADLVIFPDISKFGTMDFKKADFIYSEGQKILPEYEERLEAIRQRIYPEDYDADGKRISKHSELKTHGTYRKKPNLIPTNLVLEGALKNDEKFIQNSFAKIDDNELTPKTFENFMTSIYTTGNYESVRPRIYVDEQNDEVTMHLLLKQKPQKQMKFVNGMDFVQTISPVSMTGLTVNLDYQLRGLTGPGSIMAVGAKTINDFAASFYYMQPFNPYVFMEMNLSGLNKRYPQMPLNINESLIPNYSTTNTAEADLAFGFRTDNGNLFKLGGYWAYKKAYWFYQDDSTIFSSPQYEIADDNNISLEDAGLRLEEFLGDDVNRILNEHTVTGQNFGIYLDYSLDKLDRSLFPTKGLFLQINGDLDFCYNSTQIYKPALLLNADVQGAIPFSKYVSLLPSMFVGADLLDNMGKNPYLLLCGGYNTFDRFYFPQITNENRLGSHKMAAQLTLQIQPWNQLTILGGDAIIRISGTVGNVTTGFDRMIPDQDHWDEYPILWNANAGFGIKIKESYSIFIRAGAANKSYSDIFPFLSIDIGSIRF